MSSAGYQLFGHPPPPPSQAQAAAGLRLGSEPENPIFDPLPAPIMCSPEQHLPQGGQAQATQAHAGARAGLASGQHRGEASGSRSREDLLAGRLSQGRGSSHSGLWREPGVQKAQP